MDPIENCYISKKNTLYKHKQDNPHLFPLKGKPLGPHAVGNKYLVHPNPPPMIGPSHMGRLYQKYNAMVGTHLRTFPSLGGISSLLGPSTLRWRGLKGGLEWSANTYCRERY